MGEWHKVEPRPYSPCDGCRADSCDVSQKEVKGILYTKTDSCHETCAILGDYLKEEKKSDHLFFQNIRDAYHSIKGS